MNVIEVMVKDCTELDIIAKDIINSNGITMLAKNSIITDYIKNRLMEIGIKTVNIYSSINNLNSFKNNAIRQNQKKQYKETVLTVKNIINGLAHGKSLQYSRIIDLANTILGFSKEKERVIHCLNEVRSADEYTYSHSINVAFYSMLIASWLGFADENINEVIQAGLLHDIGKSKIPNEILNKKGKLTDEEFSIIKRHTVLGYKILEGIEGISSRVKNAVLFHHEREDGSGYPYGLRSNFIDPYAKIVAVADVFDAMTSKRVYKDKQTPFDAFEMFKTIGVGMFDSQILNVFIKNISPYYIGTKAILTNGKMGKIVYIPPQDVLYPVIEVQSDYLDLSKLDDIKIIGLD